MEEEMEESVEALLLFAIFPMIPCRSAQQRISSWSLKSPKENHRKKIRGAQQILEIFLSFFSKREREWMEHFLRMLYFPSHLSEVLEGMRIVFESKAGCRANRRLAAKLSRSLSRSLSPVHSIS